MKKFYLLTKTLLVAVCLLVGASNAWGATETLSGADATSKTNVGIVKTSFTMLGAYNPSGSTTINEKSCLKVRWQVSNASTGNTNGFALKVNTGYKITGVTAQMSGNGGTVTLKDIKVDGTSYSGEYSKTLNASNASGTKYTNITLSDINAQSYINFEIADGSAKTQGYVYITVTYEEVKDVIYTKSVTEWTSSDVTKTELTTNKWYNTDGVAKYNYLSGMYVTTTEGLRLISRNGGVKTAELKLNRSENTIVTIDAVWNAGASDTDSNTPYNVFTYGDFSLKQTVRSDDYKTQYTINGVTTTIDSNSKVTYRTEGGRVNNGNELTIHLKVNTYNGNITEFYILAPDASELVNFGNLTSTTNHFASGANYDIVRTTTYESGSSAYAWNALKSITVSEQEQAVYSYTVKGKADDSTLKTITTGENLSGTTIFYHYNQCLNVNGTLYKASTDDTGVDGNGYKSKFVLESNNQEVVKAYSQPATPITNLVFLAEGEDIFTRTTGSSADTRCSMGAGGYAGSKTAFVTLPAGTYYLVLTNRCSGNRTGIHKFYKGDDADPFFSADGNGYNAERASGAFTLSGTTTLYMQGGDASQYVDWLYIYGTYADGADATCLIENPGMETAGSGSGYQEEVKGWKNCSVVTNYRRLAFTAEQNPNGAFTGTYAFENWTDIAGGLVGQMSQTISGIPNGVYKLQLAALVNNVNGQFIYGKSNGKTYKKSIAGDTGVANDYSVIVVVEDNQLEIGLDMNGAGATWVAIDNARLTYKPDDATVSGTITPAGWASFSSNYPLDLSGIEGGTAYYASAANGETVTLTPTGDVTVPAGEGLMIKGTPNATFTIDVAASGTAIEGNRLKATDGTEIAASPSSGPGTYHYVFGYKTSDPTEYGFYNLASATSVEAGKAYLEITSNGARALRISLGGITEVENVEATSEAKAQEGKFIENGKLVIVKNGVKYNAAGAKLY